MDKKKVMAMLLATSTAVGVQVKNDKISYADNLNSDNYSLNNNARLAQKGIVVNVQTSLRIRTSPSTNSSVVGSLRNGQSFDILGKSGVWYKIKSGNLTGYIHGDYVKENGSISQGNSSSTTNKKGKVKKVQTNLRLRDKASTSGKVIGYLTNNQEFNILEKTGSWYKINVNGKVGYVHSDYVAVIEGSSNTGQNSTQKPTENNKPNTEKPNESHKVPIKGKVVKVTSNLRVRSGPGTSYSVKGSLNNNDQFNIIEKSGSWYKISKGRLEGYISGDYVQVLEYGNNSSNNSGTESKPNDINKPNTNKPENKPNEDNNQNTQKPNESNKVPTKGKVVNVTSNLRVRSGPGTSYSVKGSLNNNDQFNIIEKSGSWYKISKGSLEGYISGDYVQILEYGNNSSNNSGTESKPNDTNKPNTDNSQTNQSNGKVVYTNYNMSLNEYVRIQHERVPKYSTDYFEGYINPDKAQNQYQFLRVDKFRNINASALDAYLEKSDAGVLKGQSNAFISAAKNYSIDPLYFVAQSIHETGYGKSILAKGVTITEIADMSKEKYNDKGQLIGYEMIKLSKPTTVYNLYGIGAYDNSNVFPNRALIAGTTYAYNKGWTSVSKAISGAAEFVSTNYINSSKYEQNTLYKMRYMHNNQYIWHQYATSPWYAQSIGEQISNMTYMYSNKNDLLYDKPKFTQGRANTINIVPKVNKNTLKQSEINSPIDDGQIQ